MHYTNPYDAALALRSLEVFENWDDLIGGACGFNNTGFLFVVGPYDREKLQRNVLMLQSVGVNTSFVGPEAVLEMQPFCRVDDIGGAAYEPASGYADGYLSATSMARRARELGATIRQGTGVTAIEVDASRVVAVQTTEGRIATPIVCIAAGAWSAILARTVGLNLPVVAKRATAGALERPDALSQSHMTFIDRAIGTYYHPDTGALTHVGLRPADPSWNLPEVDPSDYDPTIPEDWMTATAARMMRRMPAMADAGWRRAWTDVDGWTPDDHMILDKAAEVDGLYFAVGMSGGGFKTGPAVGMCMAELILEGTASSVDITPFRLARFDEGEPIVAEDEYTVPPLKDLLD
jgi:sarcosine oxidase subunit beta